MATSTLHKRISIDPAVCHGKPVIKGTRVLVHVVLDALAGGDSIAAIAKDYDITEADIRAAVAYASELVSGEQHFPGSRSTG
ncbi:MAG: DUF433 domain-containing protein [Planctomycetaceae bacterium]|nr:DUF433 domain-containing protein [Planctomycetaceae bacterium]